MQTKKEKIKVIYRKFKDGNREVIALFPEISGSNPWYCLSYMHVGQHGDADVNLVNDTLPANYDEYHVLHRELMAIYDEFELVICKRISYTMHLNRTESWHNLFYVHP